MSDTKKAKTALVAWVKCLSGVPKQFILWIFADVCEDFSVLGENENHSEKKKNMVLSFREWWLIRIHEGGFSFRVMTA